MKGIILMPIIIKTIGVTLYGGFVLLSSILGIVFGISSFGAGFRARRFLPSADGRQSRQVLFYPQFLFGIFSILFFSVLLILLDGPINTFFYKNAFTYSILIIPAYLISYFFYSQGTDYFRYTSRVHYMTIAGLIFPYVHILLILLFFYFRRYLDINVLVITHVLSAFLIALPCCWVILKEIGVKFSFYRLKELVSDIRLGFPLVLGFIVDFILSGSDRYFIAFYMTVTAVGYYNPGYVLGSLIVFIPKAMGTALPQLMSKAVDGKNEVEAERMLDYAIKIFLLLAIPFVFGSMVFSKPILTLIANREVAENAYLITSVVGLGSVFYGLNLILSNVLFVRMKTYAMFKMNLIASLFNVITNAILLYIFRDIVIAGITTFLSYLIAFLYIRNIVKNEKWVVDMQPVVIVKSVAASLCMAILLFIISSLAVDVNSVIFIIGGLIFGIFAYVIGLLLLGTFSKKELQFVRGYVFRQAKS